MIASWFFFGTELDARALVAAALVGGGVALYARPVKEAAKDYELVPMCERGAAQDGNGGAN